MIFGDEMDQTTNDGDESDDDDEGIHDEDDDDDDSDDDDLGHDDDSDDVIEIDGDQEVMIAGMEGDMDGALANDWREVLDRLGGEGGADEGDEGEGEGEEGDDRDFEHPGAALIRDEEDAETDEDEEGYSDQEEMFLEGELEIDVEADQFGETRRGARNGWDNAFGGDTRGRRRMNSAFDGFLSCNTMTKEIY
jgi:hypothetical protein